jgi:diguanylate cyclase (GGDEF)-like protein
MVVDRPRRDGTRGRLHLHGCYHPSIGVPAGHRGVDTTEHLDSTPGTSRHSSDSSEELSISNLLSGSDTSTGGTIPVERVHRALSEVVRENLAPTVAVLSVLWLLIASQSVLGVGQAPSSSSALLLVVAAALFGGASLALSRLEVPLGWVHGLALSIMLAAVVIGSIVLQREPDVRTALPLLAALPVSGAVMLHGVHFAALAAVAAASWTAIAWSRFDDEDLSFFVSTLSLALIVAIYVHVTRRHTLRRIAHFRLRERARSHRLQLKIDRAYQSQAELAELSIRDPLTGAYNRRYLSHVQEELERPTAHWGAVMIDLDDFKAVNDRYGHDEGDRVLQAHVHFLRRASRAEDRLVRYGGDEFLLIVEVRSESELDEVVARLDESADSEAPAAFTVGAAFRRPREPLHAAIARADDAMYSQRGRRGRSQIYS